MYLSLAVNFSDDTTDYVSQLIRALEGLHQVITRSALDCLHDLTYRTVSSDDNPLCVWFQLAAFCWPLPELALNMNTKELGNLGLSEAEEWALVEFMKTLSDGFYPQQSRPLLSGAQGIIPCAPLLRGVTFPRRLTV